MIIDLRDNPGGLFDQGIKVADRLLPECLIAYTIDKAGEKEIFNSDEVKTDLTLVVLINDNTASTAEMLAAVIKNTESGTLVGTTTYGKGMIQETHAFDDGSAINLTTREFLIGEDVKIDGVGVEPDANIKAALTGAADLQLEGAIKLIKEGTV